MRDCELQLLAAWIGGDNQEHIKEFDQFTYFPELFECLRNTKGRIDILTVSKDSGIRTADIAKLTTQYMPSLYDSCYRMKKEEKIKGMLLDAIKAPDNIARSIKTIYEELDTLQSVRLKKPVDLCEAYRSEIQKRKITEPLKYGLPSLDYITGGIRRQELTTIAARPSIGKTALSLQIAFNLALKKSNVLFFPLEMAPFQLMERIACRETNIQHEKLKAPVKMTPKDEEILNNFLEIYGPVMKPYLNIIEGVSRLADIRRHIEHYRPSAVFIDQLTQLDENKKFSTLRDQFSYMTRSLKKITGELDVPVILLAQLNRGSEKNKEPVLSDLKESGSIEEDSDNVIMLHQTDEAIGDHTPVDIIVRKQRNGKRDVKIPCMYLNEKFVFKEIQREKGKGN